MALGDLQCPGYFTSQLSVFPQTRDRCSIGMDHPQQYHQRAPDPGDFDGDRLRYLGIVLQYVDRKMEGFEKKE